MERIKIGIEPGPVWSKCHRFTTCPLPLVIELPSSILEFNKTKTQQQFWDKKTQTVQITKKWCGKLIPKSAPNVPKRTKRITNRCHTYQFRLQFQPISIDHYDIISCPTNREYSRQFSQFPGNILVIFSSFQVSFESNRALNSHGARYHGVLFRPSSTHKNPGICRLLGVIFVVILGYTLYCWDFDVDVLLYSMIFGCWIDIWNLWKVGKGRKGDNLGDIHVWRYVCQVFLEQ